MIFMWNDAHQFEEEDEEEAVNLNDALLDELDSDDLSDDEDILEDGIVPPPEVVPEVADEEEVEDPTVRAFFEGEDEEEEETDMDYDSFDDKDDL